MSNNPHPLDILFLTNFSDYCFRSIPAVAQIADSIKTRLTIMHVYDQKRTTKAVAESKTRSFFPEADRFASCHRVTKPGRVWEAVQQHLQYWPINMIVAPASDVIGLPRIGQRSLRSDLVGSAGVPVWTIGRNTDFQRLRRPVQNVACWLDFESDQTKHLEFAAEYARVHGAQLHLLRSLPRPSEGILTHPDDARKALHPKLAVNDIKKLFEPLTNTPKIQVETGEGASTLNRMIEECGADVAFFGEENSFLADWLGLGLRKADAVPCPAIYVGNKVSVPVWNLERGPGLQPARVKVTPKGITEERDQAVAQAAPKNIGSILERHRLSRS